MKQGLRVMDSDLHTMEPDGLWEQYLDEPFKAFAPRFARASEGPPNQPTIRIGDLTIGEMTTRPSLRRAGVELHRRAVARHPHNQVAAARGYDAESHLQAMDIEGIDVAILYGTRGRQVLMHDDLDPALAAALAAHAERAGAHRRRCVVARHVDEDVHRLMASYDATRRQVFLKVRIPNALPFAFTALKYTTVLALVEVSCGHSNAEEPMTSQNFSPATSDSTASRPSMMRWS